VNTLLHYRWLLHYLYYYNYYIIGCNIMRVLWVIRCIRRYLKRQYVTWLSHAEWRTRCRELKV